MGLPNIVLIVCLIATGGLTICVACGWMEAADLRLMTVVHSRPPAMTAKPTRLTTAARDFTALGGDTLRILFLIACMAGLIADERAVVAGQLFAIFVSARLALFQLKALVKRPRPDVVGHAVTTYTTSFPSGHTFMAATLFMAAALLIPAGQTVPVRDVAVALALLVSIVIAATRLALGIHWPSDILVGWFGGIAWAIGWMLAIAAI